MAISKSDSPLCWLSGVRPARESAVTGGGYPLPPPPRLPSISRYVRKLPETLLALHDFPSVHLLMPASLSSQTKTEPDLMDCRSFSDSRRCTRGNMPRRQASNKMMASPGVRTWPSYVSIFSLLRAWMQYRGSEDAGCCPKLFAPKGKSRSG